VTACMCEVVRVMCLVTACVSEMPSVTACMCVIVSVMCLVCLSAQCDSVYSDLCVSNQY
jgi:hypothetical protein